MIKAERPARNKALFMIAVLLLFAFYWLRIIHLDQDLPPWGVGLYQPKDEGCYAILALNEMEYGRMDPEDPLPDGNHEPMYIQEHIRVNYLGNLLEMLSFRLFGDNYYGLRFPMVVIGFCNLCILMIILLLLRKQYGKGEDNELWMVFGLLLLMSVHFYSFLSSRTVEPSTLRMLFAQLVFLIWLTLGKHRRLCFFLMGLCISLSVFLVYITNVFLYLAVGLVMIMIGIKEGWKAFFRCFLWLVLGILPVFAAAEFYYRSAWGSSVLENTLGIFSSFQDISGYAVKTDKGALGLVKGAIKGFMKYFSACWFLYAPSVLFAVLMLLFPCLLTIWKKKDETLCLMLAAPAAFLLQTMVTEDYIWRKLIIVVPFFLYLMMWGFLRREEIAQYQETWLSSDGNGTDHFQRDAGRMLLRCSPVIAAGLTILFVLYHISVANDKSRLDLTRTDKLLILFLGCVPVIVWLICRHKAVRRKKPLPLIVTLGLLGGSAFLLSGTFLLRYVFISPSYEERDMLISLSEEYGLDDHYVISDFAMGITLYNDLKPVYDRHTNYGERMVNNPDLKLYHYAVDSVGFRYYIDDTLFSPDSFYTAKQIETIPGTFQTHGTVRDFALYQAAPKLEVISEYQEKYKRKSKELEQQMIEISDKNSDQYKELSEQYAELQEYYPNYYSNHLGTILLPVYVDSYGNFCGDICAPVYGDIYGNIFGDIKAPVYGDIYGDIYGDLYVACQGTIHGSLLGEIKY